jgi:hypothetical protein
MMDIAKLRRHRKLGTDLLGDFMKATPETAAELVEREGAWMRDLVLLAEPLGDAAVARLEPLTILRPHEFEVVMFCVPLDPKFDMARKCHATRLYRLDELFQQLSTVPKVAAAPARKTGRHLGHGAYDDAAAVAEIVRLVATGMNAWRAKDKAEPLAASGISTEQNAKRIYKKYKKPPPNTAPLPETPRNFSGSLTLMISMG